MPDPADSAAICQDLQQRYAGTPGLSFDVGHHGLCYADLTTGAGGATARVYLHGAHVTRFQPVGHEPVIWMSEQSVFAPGKAIRGGVPVCFPWFGPPHPPFTDDADAPQHGTVRTREWHFSGSDGSSGDGYVSVELTTQAGPLSATYTVRLDTDQLRLQMRIENQRDAPTPFEIALHSYFAVSDVHEVLVTGLENTEYLDKLPLPGESAQGYEPTLRIEGGDPIRITAETDRVYLDTLREAVIHDPGKPGAGEARRIRVAKRGAASTVLWNPWIDKSKKMADFGDDEWPGMLCIESGCIDRNAITLEGAQQHTVTVGIRAEKA